MNFNVEHMESQTVVTIETERLDAAIAPELSSMIAGLVEEGHVQILLDFDKVAFMDSSGLGAVVSGLKAVGDKGDMVVCSLHGVVEELFKLTHMDRVFVIKDNRDDGLQQLAA